MSELPSHDSDPSMVVGIPIEQFITERIGEDIDIFNKCLDHGKEYRPGVVTWFETDLNRMVSPLKDVDPHSMLDAKGSKLNPDHVTYELLESEGVNTELWRFRFDEGEKHLWGLFTPDSDVTLRLSAITDSSETPKISEFEPATWEQGLKVAESTTSLLSKEVEMLTTGIAWDNVRLEDDLDDAEQFIAKHDLTIPGIAEKGQLRPDVLNRLLDIIAANADIE